MLPDANRSCNAGTRWNAIQHESLRWARGDDGMLTPVSIDDRQGLERLLRYCAPKVQRSCTE